jgi:hypothetical protein
MKDVLLKLNILYFLILLHILPARIVLYFPILLHILPVPIVLYFLLDNFIIFLALHVKVALPENEYLYFLSSSYVLLRVTGHTSLIMRMILSFLQPLAGTLHFPNLNLCTLCRHYVHFQNWTLYFPLHDSLLEKWFLTTKNMVVKSQILVVRSH